MTFRQQPTAHFRFLAAKVKHRRKSLTVAGRRGLALGKVSSLRETVEQEASRSRDAKLDNKFAIQVEAAHENEPRLSLVVTVAMLNHKHPHPE